MECGFHSVYKTVNDRFFITYDALGEITCTDMDLVKDFIGKNNTDLYIELFGTVGDA